MTQQRRPTLLGKARVWALDYLDAAVVHAQALFRTRVPARYRRGDPGKPTIVLLPGVYERWSFLERIADELNDRGYPISIVHGLGYNRRPIVETSERLAAALSTVRANPAGRLIVAHSKGGLIGKHLMLSEGDRLGVIGLIAICTPFAGSRYARYVLDRSLRAFLPTDETIVSLASETSVNARIVSVFGPFDPHVPDGSVLAGATNVQIPVSGHFRVLRAPETIDAVIAAADLLTDPARPNDERGEG